MALRGVKRLLLKKMMYPMGRGTDDEKEKDGSNSEPTFAGTLKRQFGIQSRHDRHRPKSLAHKPMTNQRRAAVVILSCRCWPDNASPGFQTWPGSSPQGCALLPPSRHSGIESAPTLTLRQFSTRLCPAAGDHNELHHDKKPRRGQYDGRCGGHVEMKAQEHTHGTAQSAKQR
jgi:hypothetical protein